MALDARNGFPTELVPKSFAGLFFHAKQTPLVLFFFGVTIDVAVQTNFEFRPGAGVNGRCDVNMRAPNNRARVSESRNGRLPTHVDAALDIPRRRRRGTFSDAAGMRTTELRPI